MPFSMHHPELYRPYDPADAVHVVLVYQDREWEKVRHL
jgi:hypothetical protein